MIATSILLNVNILRSFFVCTCAMLLHSSTFICYNIHYRQSPQRNTQRQQLFFDSTAFICT